MKRRKERSGGGASAAVQMREAGGHPFRALRGYVPLGGADAALYTERGGFSFCAVRG